jgi:mannose-6-phosphate isomerase-like protein (cupin superfamily)
MIVKANQYREERRVIADGNGEILLRHKFEREQLFGKSRLVAEIIIKPGYSIGMHKHDPDAEIYYMLSGELVSIGADGGEEPFLPGDAMLTGGGDSHSVRNDTGKDAVMLAIVML